MDKEDLMIIATAIITATLIALGSAIFTMWLWNLIIPDITGFKEIGFVQAFGLNILGRFLTNDSKGSSD